MIIYMATGWRYQDGVARSYLFSTEEARGQFLSTAEELFNWEYQWHKSEKVLDSIINEKDDFC